MYMPQSTNTDPLPMKPTADPINEDGVNPYLMKSNES
jgi:hypothetical protein